MPSCSAPTSAAKQGYVVLQALHSMNRLTKATSSENSK